MVDLYYRRLFILKLLFLQQVLCLPVQNSTQIVYDQRQTGKYNIQISIKDVAIIEVDQNEFIDDTINNADDYYYDEDDLTINPISAWITSSTTTAKSPQLTSTSTKEPSNLQLVTNKHEVNVLNMLHTSATDVEVVHPNFNSKVNSSTPSSTHIRGTISPEITLRLEKEPVMHDQKEIKNNPQLQTAQRSEENTIIVKHVAPNKLRKVKEINSTILKVITTQPLSIKQYAICKSNYVVDSNGNCRKKRRSSFLKSFLGVLKQMRMGGI